MNNKTMRLIVILILCALAAASAVTGLVLCFRAQTAQPVLLAVDSAPEDTAALFLDTLCAGDYAAAGRYCQGGLPSEEVPTDPEAAELYRCVREHWAWEQGGEARQEGISAYVPIRFTSLDVNALSEGMNADVNARLARYVEEAEFASDVYDEQENFRSEVIQRAWEETWQDRLSRAGEFAAQVSLELELRYAQGGWVVVCGSELLGTLAGSV